MGKQKNPVKAIREFCLECMGGSRDEVTKCSRPECPVYEFRFGKNPYRTKRVLTDEQREELRVRLAKMREKKGAA